MIGPPSVKPPWIRALRLLPIFGQRAIGERVLRARRFGVAEVEPAALQLVGAGLQRHRGDGAAGAAELGVVVAGRDRDGFERLGGRHHHREQARAVDVVDAFDLHVVGQARLAVDVARQRILRVEEFRVRPERTASAGHRGDHALEVAAEAERHRGDLRAFDDAAGVGAVGLQRRRLGGDRDDFADLAGLQCEINTDGGVHVDADVLADDLLEAGEFGLDAIDGVLDVREVVDAALVGDGREGNVGALVGDVDGGAGYRPAAGIDDRSEQRPSSGLGVEVGWHGQARSAHIRQARQTTRAANVVPAPSTPLLAIRAHGSPLLPRWCNQFWGKAPLWETSV